MWNLFLHIEPETMHTEIGACIIGKLCGKSLVGPQ